LTLHILRKLKQLYYKGQKDIIKFKIIDFYHFYIFLGAARLALRASARRYATGSPVGSYLVPTALRYGFAALRIASPNQMRYCA
jgi:hypothetical protein